MGRRFSWQHMRMGLLAALLGAVACDSSPSAPDTTSAMREAPVANLPSLRSGGILYEVRTFAGERARRALSTVLERHGLVPERALVDGRVQLASIRDPAGRDAHEIASELVATGAVEFAEVDEIVTPAALPSDTLYYRQWHHGVMNSPAAWDVSTGSPDVLVAVCDGGIELTHPDLEANIAGPGYNLVDDTPDGSYVTSHGTKVSGLLGAVGNNVEGVAGVNWTVRILSLRVTNSPEGGALLSTLVECIDYARLQGARVVNISYNGIRGSSAANAAGEALKAAGGLLFVVAGNENRHENTKNHPGILVIGATDSTDARASFSNYGKMIDLVAPGARLTTTQLTTNTVQGPYNRNENGTSFATPLAAGVAALVWAVRPDLSPAAVQDILFRSARDLGGAGYDQEFGYGRVDAGAALALALTATEPPPPPGGGKKNKG